MKCGMLWCSSELFVSAAKFADDGTYERFCVAEKHECTVQIVERIIDARETRGHAALNHHDSSRFVHVQHGHAENRARSVGARGGVGDVVGTNHECHVSLWKISVDFVRIEEFVVRNVRFGEKDVHVAGHTASDRMDAELYVDATLGEGVVELAHFVLGLGNGHSVAGYNDNFVRGSEDGGGFFWRCAPHGTGFLFACGRGLLLSKCAEEHVGERAVHGFRHIYGKNEAGSPIQRAGDDQEFAVENKAHGRGGETGVGIQKGDDGRHIGAADGNDHHYAEEKRNTYDEWKKIGPFRVGDQHP